MEWLFFLKTLKIRDESDFIKKVSRRPDFDASKKTTRFSVDNENVAHPHTLPGVPPKIRNKGLKWK